MADAAAAGVTDAKEGGPGLPHRGGAGGTWSEKAKRIRKEQRSMIMGI